VILNRMACFLAISAGAACQQSDLAHKSDSELHAMTSNMSLEETYEFYTQVYHSQIPSRPVIASDLVKFGDEAWYFSYQRALSNGFNQFDMALPVLSAFDRKCSEREFSELVEKSKQFSNDEGRRATWVLRIRSACNFELRD
jgi:hypothetical protein